MSDFDKLQQAWEEIGLLKSQIVHLEQALERIAGLSSSSNRSIDDYGNIARTALGG